jgi:subtilisin family serine protease
VIYRTKSYTFLLAKLKYIIVTIALIFIGFSSCTEDFKEDNVLSNVATRSLQETDFDLSFFYTGKDEKACFNIQKDRVIIKTTSAEEAKRLCKQDVFLSDRPAYDIAYIWVLASIDPEKTNLDDLLKLPGVVDAAYGLEYEDGTLQYSTDKIYVNFKGASPKDALAKVELTESIVTADLYDADRKGYNVTLDVKLSDVLQICRELYESDMCEWAEPSFFREMKPNNTHYGQQWSLNNTGQYGGTVGIDINAEQAWTITRGSTNITVAIIDEGVDLTHPDLQGNLLTGYDATVGAPGGANGSPYGNNAHGTACAGIIGAINNAIGVVGVASGCKIVPVRIAYDRNNSGFWTINDDWVAAGINYAWQTAQADVLSNSWSGGSSSITINNAIYDATTKGRGYKGCVVVFSSGNNYASTVNYPTNLPNVIAVGSIDRYGYRASSSNFGAALDIVAPGGSSIYTTDIQGSLGYNNGNGAAGNYAPSFGGTSAAAPHVAGVAALILSANPNLTRKQLVNRIESTAQKVGGYGYAATSGHPNGTWNNQIGYGLVDAYAVLTGTSSSNLNTPVISLGLAPHSGSNQVTAVFSVDNLQSGVTYQWEVNGSIKTNWPYTYITFLSAFITT